MLKITQPVKSKFRTRNQLICLLFSPILVDSNEFLWMEGIEGTAENRMVT